MTICKDCKFFVTDEKNVDMGSCRRMPLKTTRTIRYWLTGKRVIRPLVAERIKQLAREKAMDGRTEPVCLTPNKGED